MEKNSFSLELSLTRDTYDIYREEILSMGGVLFSTFDFL